MNSIDRELIEQAATLLTTAPTGANANAAMREANREWYGRVSEWLDRCRAAGVVAGAVAIRPEGIRPGGDSRWRPIAAEGTVSPDPAPEHPDEADEGETGPPEMKL